MAVTTQYSDSCVLDNPEQQSNWRSIGEIVKEFLPIEESLIDYDDDMGAEDDR